MPYLLRSKTLSVLFLKSSNQISSERMLLDSMGFFYLIVVVLVQSLRPVWLFVTPRNAVHQAPLSFTISPSLLKLRSIESVMPSNHFIPCHPLLLLPSIFPSIKVFSNESVLWISWPNYWSLSFSISLSTEHSGLISCRIDWLDHLDIQGILKSLSNTTVQNHQFFCTQPSLWSKSYIYTWLLEKP